MAETATSDAPQLHSAVDPHDAGFVRNAEAHRALVADLNAQLATARLGGPQRARARHVERGKLLPRERVDALVDPSSPFLELSPLAAHGLYGGEAPAAGIITGIGRVAGRECVIVANDATVKGGTYYPLTVKKHLRAQEVALQNRLPCIYLVDSGGAYLPMQDEVFPDREHFGRIFYNQAQMSAAGHPADRRGAGVVHGGRGVRAGDERRGGDRPQPGDDLPRRAAAGEGGHRRGRDGRGAGRGRPARARSPGSPTTWPTTTRTRCASSGRSSGPSGRGRARPWDVAPTVEPVVDPTELYGVVPTDPRIPYDVREVIARIVDGSRFHEFKPLYGPTLVTGFARLHGHPVGIVANNGILFSESALKGAHFVELCDQRGRAAGVPAEHHRVHGRPGVRGGRDRQERREDGDGGGDDPGAEADGRDRRVVRGGELLDVRAGVLAAAAVPVAERADLGDGRGAGGDGAVDGAQPGRPRAGGGVPAADPGAVRDPGPSLLLDGAAVGRRGDRPRRHPHRAGPGPVAAANAPLADPAFGVFRM